MIYGSIHYRGSRYVVADADDIGDVHVWSGDPDDDNAVRVATVHALAEYPQARFRVGFPMNWGMVRQAVALYRAAAGLIRECDQ